MEQLDKLINNVNNSHVVLFVSGFLVPIVLYFLAATSFEKVLGKLTFWKWNKTTKFLCAVGFIILVNSVFLSAVMLDNDDDNLHSTHIDSSDKTQELMAKMPGMDGDRTKRYTVSFLHPEKIEPNKEVELVFKVNDASTGNQTKLFRFFYENLAHLIIVDSDLQSFKHIHTNQEKDGFVMTAQFPKEGVYHVYLDFQPWGAIEQQFGFTVNVGNVQKPVLSDAKPDTSTPKVFGDYTVKLTSPLLEAKQMSLAQQKMRFTITNVKTGKPITTLKPYLQAFGHLVMINQETFEFLHVHPDTLIPVMPEEIGGPDVTFVPMAIYTPFKPGIYRAFAEFNPDGKLVTADFTVEVK